MLSKRNFILSVLFILYQFSITSNTLFGQTLVFTDPGLSYTNTDGPTGPDIYNIDISDCTSVDISLDYSFSLPWEGSGNMEISDDCGIGSCAGDPAMPLAGGCSGCWDFLWVRIYLDGIQVGVELIGETGTTDAEQMGTIEFLDICTNGASQLSINIVTQTWAANETVTFENIEVFCLEAQPVINTNDPLCAGDILNLSGSATDESVVMSWNWTNNGPGNISAPENQSTTASNASNGETYILTTTDVNGCSGSSSVVVVIENLVDPVFDAIEPPCSTDGIIVLPNQSNNGISGIWTPASINPATDGPIFIATFTPNAGECANETMINVPIRDCGCTLTPLLTQANCDDNGTPSNLADDFFVIMVNADVSPASPSNQFNVLINGVIVGTFNYNSVQQFNYPANDPNIVLVFQDVDNNSCQAVENLNIGIPCPEACTIDVLTASATCNDNGTPGNTDDDFYDVSINASSSNPGPSGQYNLFVGNVLVGTFSYNSNQMINVATDDINSILTFQDVDDNSCQNTAIINIIDTCSEPCSLSILMATAVCNDNGTPTNPNDDFYVVNLDATSTNGGSSGQYNILVNNMIVATFNYDSPQNIQVGNVGNNITLVFQDADFPSCEMSTILSVTNSCPQPCSLTIDQLSPQCDDNGTPNNTSDDFYTISVIIDAANGGSSNQYNILINNLIVETFSYNITESFNLPADGSTVTMTFEDADVVTCQIQENIGPLDPCPIPCSLTVVNPVSSCDDNDTPSNTADDFYVITVDASAVNGGASNQFNVVVGAMTFGPYDYNMGGTFNLNADGSSPNLVFQDVDNTACQDIQGVGPLDHCSTDCQLTIITASTACDDNDTPSNTTDDFYVITVDASVVNGGASNQFNVVVGAMTFGPYDYNMGGTFNLNADGSSPNLVFQDVDNTACQDNQGVGPLDHCSTDCQLTIITASTACDDNDTPSNTADDFYVITVDASAVNGGASNQFNVVVGGMTFGPFDYNSGGIFNLLADGSSPNLVFQDADNTACQDNQGVGPLDHCSTDCQLTIITASTACDDNNTPSNTADDFYVVTVDASAVNSGAAGQFNVLVGGMTFGPFDYNSGGTFNLNADGSSPNLVFQDADNTACQDNQGVGPLDHCSTDCQLTIITASTACDDNNTPSNTADDFYVVTVDASAVNSGAAGQFNVLVGGMTFGPFDYNSGGTFNLNADGSSPNLVFQDADNTACQDNQGVVPLDHCSTDCQLTIITASTACDDNDTPSNTADDFYIITVDASVINGGPANQFNVVVGGMTFGPFDYNMGGTFNLLADGSSPNLVFQDADNTACQDNQGVGPLDHCSTDCQLTIITASTACDDNNTPTNTADDFYVITLDASAINGGPTNQFNVVVGGMTFGPFDYNLGGTFNLSADGSSPNLVFQDADNTACQDNQVVGPLDHCSTDCQLTIITASTACDDNDTPTNTADDFYIVTVDASAVNSGASNQFNVVVGAMTFGPYNYNMGGTFNLLADGSSPNLVFQDADNTACQDNQGVGPLDHCSTDCQLTIITASTSCNDNDTPTNTADDFYVITVDASVINGGPTNQFNVVVGGMTFGPFDYNSGGTFNLLADGSSPNLVFQDADNTACQDNQGVGPLDHCSTDCQLTIITASTSCNDNDTPTNTADDFYVITVDASVINGGPTNQFNVVVGGMTFGPFDYNSGGTFNLLADGSSPNLVFQDADNTACQDNQGVGPLDHCSTDCQLTIITASTACDDNDTPSNTADDFYVITVDASAVNGGPANQFNVVVGGMTFGPFDYNSGGTFNLLADGSSPNLLFQDTDDTACQDNQGVGPLSPCSMSCPFESANLSNLMCNDNETPMASDDFLTFSLDPEGNIMGSYSVTVSSGTISPTMANYGTQTMFQLQNGSAGSGNVTVIIDGIDVFPCAVDIIDLGPCSSCPEETPLITVLQPDTLHCNQSNVTIDATNSQIGADIVYQWYDQGFMEIVGANAGSITVDIPGTYYLELTDVSENCVNVDTVEVFASSLDSFNLDIQSVDCTDEGVTLSIGPVFGDSPPYQYSLDGSPFSQNDTYQNIANGVHYITVSDNNGCTVVDSITTDVMSGFTIDLGVSQSISFGDSVQLMVTSSETNLTYAWDDSPFLSCLDCPNPIAKPTVTTTFTVLATNADGCTDEASILVVVREDYDIYIPNAFTPTGDGTNDRFMVFGDEHVRSIKSMALYNRWGDQVFKSFDLIPNNELQGWDGNYRGEPALVGVYMYYIEVELVNGRVLSFAGDFTLIR